MLRFGLVCLFLCLCTMALASLLDYSHVVVFGPCAGVGAAAIYVSLLVTSGLGVLFTIVGAGAKLVRKLRQSQ